MIDTKHDQVFVLTAHELRRAGVKGRSPRPDSIRLAVFRGEDDAYAAIEDGNEETVHPVQIVTADGGRTGWPVTDTAWPVVHDVENYLRARGLARLSAEERSALPIAKSQPRARADRSRHAFPSAGLITVHGAYMDVAHKAPAKLVALFCDDADALRAAKDLSNVAGSDGHTAPLRTVTLDGGLSCHLLGDEPPLRIWELAAYLAERGRAKLTSEERAALGLAPEPPVPAILTVYEVLEVHVDRGIGGNVMKNMTGVGVFLRAAEAQQAAKGLCNEEGQDGETRPVRLLTTDGRTGWKLPFGHDRASDCEEGPPVTVWHGIDAYFRERARARLTAGERLALLPPVEHETGGPPAAPRLRGLVTLYQATQIAEHSLTHVVGYFVD